MSEQALWDNKTKHKKHPNDTKISIKSKSGLKGEKEFKSLMSLLPKPTGDPYQNFIPKIIN